MNTEKFKNFLFYGQFLFFIFMVLVWLGYLFSFSMDPDYTSGELLDHLLTWIHTGKIYLPLGEDHPYRILNYPPLFFIFAGWISKLGMAPFVAARILSVFAFVLASSILFLWLKREGVSLKGCLWIITLTTTSIPIFYSLGQFQIHLLAIAITLTGFYFLGHLRSHPQAILSACFLVLACFVKHTQVISVLAALLWMIVYRNKYFFTHVLTTLLLGIAGLLAIQLSFGTEVWRHLYNYTVGQYSFAQFFEQWASFFLPWFIFFGLGIWISIQQPAQRKDLRWWYFVGSSVWIVLATRIGSGYHYYTEWAFAVLLWIGPSLANWIENKNGGHVQPAHTFGLVFQIIGANVALGILLYVNITHLAQAESALPQICKEFENISASIPAEPPSMVLACNKQPALHPFIMSSLANQGLWDETPFLQKLSDGTYPVLLLPNRPENLPTKIQKQRWTPAMRSAMIHHYEVSKQIGDSFILRWKQN